ncbi:efflux transporter periplasmic adaptor subunit [Aliidiomarina minuta]|uniref:Efflux transporter periplasmic adaptor subunit n=1 Tax=Aliidiomarina minuta TaxID=880057 RepID=A0A432W4K2_9GAMM|nr:efflux RND transporter periplasmic adaptor subunit [Aliidiomarina minuta]RUO24380.1 efflux transporter periplasmic adaptor subunit [Aliidiomarina minuta]
MIKRMILMLVAVTVILGLIFGYKAIGNHFMNEFFDNMPMPAASITATEVIESNWTPTTRAVGSFVAVQGTELTSQASGIVTAIHFENGQQVTEGQPLVSLDTEVDEAELARLKAMLDIAELDAERLERLQTDRNISESEVQRARSEALQAKAAVDARKAEIRKKTIKAPFNGVVGLRQVNLGQYLSPGQAVVSIQSLDPVYLNFSLPEQRLSEIRLGHVLRVRVDAYPDRVFEGSITAIEPSVRQSTRTFEIQGLFDNDDEYLRPGMFGRVEMDLGDSKSVKVIPQTAVQFNPYGNLVYVINENDDGGLFVQQRLIRTGRTQGDLIEVTEGLELGEQIATSGLLKLRNEAAVKINTDPALQPPADSAPRPANQ